MPLASAPRVPLADLPAWIARQVTGADDGGAVLAEVGRSLVAAGIPVRLVGFGTRALSVAHRGVMLTWRPDVDEVEIAFAPHGAEEREPSPIGTALDAGRPFMRWDLARGEGCAVLPALGRLRAEGCTEYLVDIAAFPPGTALRGVGLFYATDRPGGFTGADLAALAGFRDVYSLAVFRFALSYALTGLLDAYVGARTAPMVLNGRVRRGEGELISCAILLADLKGFTALADREDPRRLVGWLDEHLDALGREVGRNGGEIFKFTGDGFIAAFPAQEAAAAAWLAVDLALHFGPVVHGNIGTADRLDFTAIGRAVNEASRIEALCDATGRNLLVSDSFARRCRADLVDLGRFSLRGVEAPQRLWTVAEA